MTPVSRALLSSSMLFVFAAPATAQNTAVYGTVALTAYGTNDGSGSKIYLNGDRGGGIVGGFFNFPIDSRFKPGVDARVMYTPTSTGGTSFLVLGRVSFVPDVVRLRPYFEVGGGVVHTSGPSSTTTATGPSTIFTTTSSSGRSAGGVAIILGLDIRLTPRFDLRAIDYGAATGGRTGTAFLDSGVVFHFGS